MMSEYASPRVVTATRWIRSTRGGSQAHLVEANDGAHYVTKFVENPQGRRILINELISWFILEHLGIATPEVVLLQVTEEFLRDNGNCRFTGRNRPATIKPGLHFGSAVPVDPEREPVYDFIPDPLLGRVHNICEVLGALVFDRWVANSDGRQMVFFKATAIVNYSPGDSLPCGYLCTILDNGHAFNGTAWAYHQGLLSGLYPRRAVYRGVRALEDFQPWLDLAIGLPEELLWHAVSQIPEEWVRRGETAELERLMCTLIRRKRDLPESLVHLCSSQPSVFPNWS